MYKILIYLEKAHLKSSLDLIKVAEIIGKSKEDYEICGVGLNLSDELEIINLDKAINIHASIIDYDTMNISKILQKIHEEQKFDCILVSATTFGRMLAPRLAIKLNTGLVADVTEVSVEDDKLIMVRPAFTGKIMAGITCDKNPVMMSIRPGIFKKNDTTKKTPKWSIYEPIIPIPMIRQVEATFKSLSSDIRDGKLLVSCGGGMDNKLESAKLLAEKLNGKLSVSRRPVDSGAASRTIQVGQSGKIVSPKIYIALGISGSQQHIEGLKDIETIISVNTDKYAALNHLANFVVEGDGHEFIELLLKRLQ